MTPLDASLGVALGLGLAASTGFRVFVPLLILSAAALYGYVPLSEPMGWIGTWPALIMFAVASVAEVVAYYIPGVDHALDVVATPAALIAGPLAAASVMVGFPPAVQWSLAIIGGGVAAGAAQGTTTALRLKSAALTGGLGNGLVATGELLGAVSVALLAILLPALAITLVIVLMFVAYRLTQRIFFGRASKPA